MKILLFGSTGQVGGKLLPLLKEAGVLSALSRSDADLENSDAVHRVLDLHRPDVIVNAAAYTSVDKAETERQQVFDINVTAPKIMANWAHTNDARIIHFSSDYVYDGVGNSLRAENDGLGPLNTYGESKLAGDKAIVASHAKAIILRTSWVYGGIGRSFLSAILERAKTTCVLKVVDDQVGTPTSATWLANTTLKILLHWLDNPNELNSTSTRVFHAIPAGYTSWMGFATALLEEARRYDLAIGNCRAVGISTKDWPTAANRPKNTRLSSNELNTTFGIHGPNWRTLIRAEIATYASINQNCIC